MRAPVSKLVLAIAMLAAASLACQALSSLPTNLLPTPSSSTGDNTPSGGEDASILSDDFSDSGSGWGTGTDSDSSVEYVGGGLHMQVFKANFFTWSNPDTETYKNIHMEVTVSNESGGKRAGYGLMCNQQVTDTSYYYFAVTSDGEYVIGKSAVGKEDVFLTNNDNWGTSDYITPNAASYRVGADCAGGNLALYVNGHKIDSASDPDYTDGGVGLFLWSGDEALGTVTYDNFVMTALK